MREVTIKVYRYDELSDAAKAKAREWYRQFEESSFGAFGELYEPIETAAGLLGVSFATRKVRTMGGTDRSEPNIHWNLDYSHLPGASFSGSYRYKARSSRLVAREFPQDAELQRIAGELEKFQRAHGYRLVADIMETDADAHWRSMEIVVFKDLSARMNGSADYTPLLKSLQDFARWIFRYIEVEYQYRTADAQIAEGIRANEYEFRDDGSVYNG